MDHELLKAAKALAARNYQVIVEREDRPRGRNDLGGIYARSAILRSGRKLGAGSQERARDCQ